MTPGEPKTSPNKPKPSKTIPTFWLSGSPHKHCSCSDSRIAIETHLGQSLLDTRGMSSRLDEFTFYDDPTFKTATSVIGQRGDVSMVCLEAYIVRFGICVLSICICPPLGTAHRILQT